MHNVSIYFQNLNRKAQVNVMTSVGGLLQIRRDHLHLSGQFLGFITIITYSKIQNNQIWYITKNSLWFFNNQKNQFWYITTILCHTPKIKRTGSDIQPWFSKYQNHNRLQICSFFDEKGYFFEAFEKIETYCCFILIFYSKNWDR